MQRGADGEVGQDVADRFGPCRHPGGQRRALPATVEGAWGEPDDHGRDHRQRQRAGQAVADDERGRRSTRPRSPGTGTATASPRPGAAAPPGPGGPGGRADAAVAGGGAVRCRVNPVTSRYAATAARKAMSRVTAARRSLAQVADRDAPGQAAVDAALQLGAQRRPGRSTPSVRRAPRGGTRLEHELVVAQLGGTVQISITWRSRPSLADEVQRGRLAVHDDVDQPGERAAQLGRRVARRRPLGGER